MELLFAKAMLTGFAIAAPLGPIGVLCMQRGLRHGAWVGFISGLGAASADACFGALGAVGFGVLVQGFANGARWFSLGGALFMAWLGLGMLRGGSVEGGESEAHLPLVQAWFSVLLLTLTNPMTILSFAAVYAALSDHPAASFSGPVTIAAGVFCGSALWWGLLAGCVGRLRHRLGERARHGVGRLAGCLLLGLACWQLMAHWPV
jgi:threonine/homoserine/homoserine lactone efflux protein